MLTLAVMLLAIGVWAVAVLWFILLLQGGSKR